MKKLSVTFLQIVIVLIGIGALVFLLWEPHLEGRNVHATLFDIYFNDPFLVYAYTASLAFFLALYQAFRVLGYIRRNETFSPATVQAVRGIKHCALVLIAFIAGAEAYFFIVQRSKDDIAGGVVMGLALMLVSVVVAAGAAVFERVLQNNPQ